MGLHVAQVYSLLHTESYGCEMRRKSAAVSDHGTGPFDFRAVCGRSLVVAGIPVPRRALKIVSLNSYWKLQQHLTQPKSAHISYDVHYSQL